MGKEELSNQYLDQVKEKFGHLKLKHKNRAAVVVGVNVFQPNIGFAITNTLTKMDEYEIVLAPRIDELNVCNVSQCASYFKTMPAMTDTLVLSHGVTYLDWFENQPNLDITDIIRTNVMGTINALQAFVNASMDFPFRKSIVVMGSMAYRNVLNASAVYCASKAAVAMLVRSLGWELTPKGFNIFCVHPSNTIDTPMTEHTIRELAKYRGISMAQAEDYWASVKLTPEWLSAYDIAEVVVDLVMNESAIFQSGTQIELSGGQR